MRPPSPSFAPSCSCGSSSSIGEDEGVDKYLSSATVNLRKRAAGQALEEVPDKEGDKEEEKVEVGNGMKATDEEEILRLKALLESKENEMEEKKREAAEEMEAKKREIAEEREENRVKFMAKEKEIQERNEMIQERNEMLQKRDEMIQERDEKIARLEDRIAGE